MSMEIRASNYNHPERETGQHTNGPAMLYVRWTRADPWFRVIDIISMHKVRRLIEAVGFHAFVDVYCERVDG